MSEIRRSLLVAIVMLLAPLPTEAESSPTVPKISKEASSTARRDAQASFDAFLKGDVEKFASFMYPGAVKLLGGKEKMVAMLRRGLEDMKAQGTRFKSANASEPEHVVIAGQDLLTIVPVKQVMIVPDGELHISSHLLGISSDNGKSWTFVDTVKLTPENVRSVVPHFNPDLKLPPKQQPTLVPTKRETR